MIRLRDILKIVGSGEFLRISCEYGKGILFYDSTTHLYVTIKEDFLNREVTNIYSVEERPTSKYALGLEAGLMIVIAGYENGKI